MQDREFDNLMNGKPSKMAFIPDMMPLDKITKQYVAQNEVATLQPIVSAVAIWVDRCRKLGMSEKNIRKSVLRRFKIKLVK
jgi:hypothetical protein